MLKINLKEYPCVGLIHEVLIESAPYLANVIFKQHSEFGDSWLLEFESDLATFFSGNADSLRLAVQGYIKFALDGMLLQKRFDKSGVYEFKTYDQAAAEVYQNEKYMHELYLPGIYLSHYLWRHHFIQHLYFLDRFIPMVKAHGGTSYYDVGVGTGFYLREMLRIVPSLQGEGFDMSPSSLSYTDKMLIAFDLRDRYRLNLKNILTGAPIPPANFLTNIEVLEHLEDPLSFLKGLNKMLAPGGLGFITAAVTAPNADHIYLYNSVDELIEQAEAAGFLIIESREDKAYEPRRPNESIPKNAIIIVSK